MRVLRLGTRGSPLALWQAGYVADRLKENFPGLNIDVRVISTTGDKILDVALAKIGDKGLFTKEIEHALLAGEIDFAVHSMKDLPSALTPGLGIAAIMEREAAEDALVARQAPNLSALPPGARLGTSSLRRGSQLKAFRPDFQIVEIRGNVDTRLRRMEELALDGVLLAAAGLRRLGLAGRITELLTPDVVLPAVGQGALGVETRQGDRVVQDLISVLNHPASAVCVKMERSFLSALGGGCQTPAAALGSVQAEHLVLDGLIASLDGRQVLRGSMICNWDDAESTGTRLAEQLLSQGGREMLGGLRVES